MDKCCLHDNCTCVTPADSRSIKGAELKRVMCHFNLPIKIMGETADGQHKRLKLYLEKWASGNSLAADKWLTFSKEQINHAGEGKP